MKTIYAIILTCVFIYLTCEVNENPLKVQDSDSALSLKSQTLPKVKSINPANKWQLEDQDPLMSGIQGKIVIEFTEYMDSSTINLNNISIKVIDGPIPIGTRIKYVPFRKTVILENDLLPIRSAFLLEMSKVTDIHGNPLDGNGNGVYDEDHDVFTSQFYTSGGSDKLLDLDCPTITNWQPRGNFVPVDPTIRIDFASSGMDTLTLNADNILLEESETSFQVSLSRTFVSMNSVEFTPNFELESGTKYKVVVHSTWVKALNGKTLDIDGDGAGLPTEDNFMWEFITKPDTGIDATPPQVDRINTNYSDHAEIIFNEEMDGSTFTSRNIRFFDSNGNLPGVIDVSGTEYMLNFYYNRQTVGQILYFVSMEVKDKSGNKLDGDKDGIGGEPGEDDYTNLF